MYTTVLDVHVCGAYLRMVEPVERSVHGGTCLSIRRSLCWAATSLKWPASLAPNSTKALQSTSVEQPLLYKGQLELAHR